MKYFSITCILLIHVNLYAEKLTYYECPTEKDASRCSRKCEKDDSALVEFDVSIQRNIVIKKNFDSLSGDRIVFLENCKIFDKNNWSCSKYSSFPNNEYQSFSQSMINGIFYSVNVGNTLNKKHEIFLCAK